MSSPTIPLVGRSTVRSVSCPECGAIPESKCLGHNGKPRTSCHADRWIAYRQQASAALVQRSSTTTH
ncbi:zinc finger domain-containing protein [Delftia tsuruhatensis]|uniref:zinc finger domain-containing protein n=1 Tax=Delftia tsuruhatensis TaxID=180282 RepID=UPI003C7A76C6